MESPGGGGVGVGLGDGLADAEADGAGEPDPPRFPDGADVAATQVVTVPPMVETWSGSP